MWLNYLGFFDEEDKTTDIKSVKYCEVIFTAGWESGGVNADVYLTELWT